MSQYISLYC